jgi:integrase
MENGTITPKTAKNGAARILKLPDSTLAMLREYLKIQCQANRYFVSTHKKAMSHVGSYKKPIS